MTHYGINDWFFGWGWFIWLAFLILMFSSLGNWGYTYRAHQKYGGQPLKDALDLLNERYVRGDIAREQYLQQKGDISAK